MFQVHRCKRTKLERREISSTLVLLHLDKRHFGQCLFVFSALPTKSCKGKNSRSLCFFFYLPLSLLIHSLPITTLCPILVSLTEPFPLTFIFSLSFSLFLSNSAHSQPQSLPVLPSLFSSSPLPIPAPLFPCYVNDSLGKPH